MAQTIQQKRAAFRALHAQGCFVLPNPWDVGSALFLQQMGFKALATTSSGHAWSQGLPDGSTSRDEVIAHMRKLVSATDLPINADFESGFADDPAGVAQSVRMALDTGVAGLSLEDSTGNPDAPLLSIDDAVARLRAARAAIDEAGGDTLLIGRAENFFVGRPDLDDAITRLKAYAEAGADCLYAPGIRTREQITAVVSAVAPKPVNLLVGTTIEFTLQDIEAMGVRRVSVGGAMARAAWGGLQRAASMLAREGRFDGFADAMSQAQLNALFKKEAGQANDQA
ncbi:isocitrate lyase/phosphoenolpyruvate mutase family protein [Allopusillimonas soli]|uniref:Isocitrate lyase/phosphoenolpyruvate mutase family protein n=1 Tax=Allopusillimonas soli TaxID=659016 RepID=A0A853F8S6_9BURK|nr:isocitrate lyase/phosphoenolpyruvate mutase family protein [Allopusillimonas soli]NYT35350.1 isocitrate lyase/phosphoenolpyruvate mutase family protein [Allopusillimonas soli]TEA75770.1 isocitrate lyase/phosphoenolpyruvate mutase family protein [Allopusillimonas soli]